MRFPTFLSAALCASLVISSASAQNTIPQPQLLSVFPPGAKAGTALELQITEEVDLAVATGLLFSHPGIKAQPITPKPDRFHPQPKPLRDRFNVTIDAKVPPGVYEVRAKCRYGVSNARRFVVSNQTELTEEEPNNEIEQANKIALGSTINGIFASDFDTYKLNVQKGQKLVIDCLSQRIDSRGDPVLTLLDQNGKTIQRSQDSVGNDATIVFTADRDQTCFVRVNDLTFMAEGGSGTAVYRLTVREGPWIDYVDPPIAILGESNRLTVYGRNLGGKPVEGASISGLQKIDINFTPPSNPESTSNALKQLVIEPFRVDDNLFAFRHTIAGKQSNAFPISLVVEEMIAEVEPNDAIESAHSISSGSVILGTFAGSNDADRYRFTAKKDERFQIQVESHQLHGSSDPLMVVQVIDKQEDGTVKTRDVKVVDDETSDSNTWRFRWSTNDPALEFVAPADGDYLILVQNQYGADRGFPDNYRLSFNQSKSGFRLNAVAGLLVGQTNNRNIPIYPNACVVRRGSSTEILLIAKRNGGFLEEIQCKAENLPAGVTASPTIIGRGETFASMTLSATGNAAPWAGKIRLVGTAKSPETNQQLSQTATAIEIVRPTANNNNMTQAPARVGESIYVTVVEDTPVVGRIDTPDTALRMARGGRLELPLKFAKTGEFTGNINAFACGLPNLVARGNVNLTPNGTEAKMNIDIQQNCESGSYSFFVRADLDTNFRRYPELMDEARADQTRIGKLYNDLNQAYQVSIRTRSSAEQQQRNATSQKSIAANLVRQRQQELARVAPTLKATQQELTKSSESLKLVEQQLVAAQKAFSVANDEAGKKQAQEMLNLKQQEQKTAETNRNTAKTRHEQTVVQHEKAKTQLDAATKQMQTASEALTKAVAELEKARTAETDAKNDRDLAQQKKSDTDRWVQRANQISQERRVKTYVYSPPITIDILEFPIEFKLDKETYEVAAGEKLSLKLTATRDFDAKDEVRFQLLPPSGVSGWSLGSNQSIKKNEDSIATDLNINANTNPGDYTAKLRGGYRFNNRFINQEIAIPIRVKPAADANAKPK